MDQSIREAQAPIQGRVTIPGSKSITNRALLLAALANGASEISDMLISDDTLAMVGALQELGVDIQLDKNSRSCQIQGSGGKFPRREATIWCADSGTVARFLLAACINSPGVYHFDGSEQLCQRPMATLIEVLSALGGNIHFSGENKKIPAKLISTGVINGGNIYIDASETGQFVSALLMIAPYAKNSLIIQTKEAVSYPYIEMTSKMMTEFGVIVQCTSQSNFLVHAPQQYQAQKYTVEPDLSTSSYFFAAAAVTAGEVTIQAIDRENVKQGDIAFLKVLEQMGCKVLANSEGLTVKGVPELNGVEVDMRDFSDTFMTLAALAPFAATPTMITHIGHARNKESDRITVMCTELEKLGVKVDQNTDWLKIYPSKPIGAVIDSHQDHRIAMAFSIIGLRVPEIVIKGAECVSKTCPEFFTLWDGLY